MAEIVNLRRVRKQRARQDAEDEAQTNRIAFGRTKAQRQIAEAERAKAARDLDGHLLRRDEPDRP